MDYMIGLGQKTAIYETMFNQLNHVTNVLDSSTNHHINLPHPKKPINGTCHYVCILSPKRMVDEIN